MIAQGRAQRRPGEAACLTQRREGAKEKKERRRRPANIDWSWHAYPKRVNTPMTAKRSQTLAGGKRSATSGKLRTHGQHPEGMPARLQCVFRKRDRTRPREAVLASLRDAIGSAATHPVVALRLPPANVCNAFGVCVLAVNSVRHLTFSRWNRSHIPHFTRLPRVVVSIENGIKIKKHQNSRRYLLTFPRNLVS
jgi:hypothetical protein